MTIINLEDLIRYKVGFLPFAALNWCDRDLYRYYRDNIWNPSEMHFYPFPISNKIKPDCSNETGGAELTCNEPPGTDKLVDTSGLEIRNYQLNVPPTAILENLSPFFFQIANFKNDTSSTQTYTTLEYSEKLIETTTTKTTHGCKTGTKITAKQSFKVPYIGTTEFAAEIFAEYNFSSEVTETTTSEKHLRVPPLNVIVKPGTGVRVTASVSRGFLQAKDARLSMELAGRFAFRSGGNLHSYGDLYPWLFTYNQVCPTQFDFNFYQNGFSFIPARSTIIFNGKTNIESTFMAALFEVTMEEYDLVRNAVIKTIVKTYDLATSTLILERVQNSPLIHYGLQPKKNFFEN